MDTELAKVYYLTAPIPAAIGSLLDAVRDARTRWEYDRIAEVFGEPWFTHLRYAVHRAGVRDRLSTRDYAWMLLGALFDGRMPVSLVPRPDDPATLVAARYWLAQRAYREPRYRTAILLQRSTLPGRHQVAAAAVAASDHPHPAEFLRAIRDRAVVEFIGDPKCAADLDPALPSDVRQRHHMLAFAYWIRAVDAETRRSAAGPPPRRPEDRPAWSGPESRCV